MKNNPVQLLFNRYFKSGSILFHAVNADIDLPLNWVPGGRKPKGYNVCIIIVFKKALVNSQQKLV